MKEDPFKEFVLDQLRELESLRCRPMFGGYGLYLGETFFGIVHDGVLYLKTSQATRAEFVRRGMRPFRPSDSQTLKTYYQVPPEILEDRNALVEWSQRSAKRELRPSKRHAARRP